MNGIAIVIPNADFSGSPLGKVTFVKSAAERATPDNARKRIGSSREELLTRCLKATPLNTL